MLKNSWEVKPKDVICIGCKQIMVEAVDIDFLSGTATYKYTLHKRKNSDNVYAYESCIDINNKVAVLEVSNEL